MTDNILRIKPNRQNNNFLNKLASSFMTTVPPNAKRDPWIELKEEFKKYINTT